MEKINYLSWKEENFWKRIKGFSLFIYFVSYFVVGITDSLNPLYWLLPFGFLGLYWLACIPEEFYDKDVKIIRQYILWRGVFFSCLLALDAIVTVVLAENPIGVLYLWITLVALMIPLEIFKEKIYNSNTVFRYIVDDKPKLFSKRFFKESNKVQIVFTFMFVLFMFASCVLVVGTRYFHWNIGFMKLR
jgi:hypothetical protein